MKEILFNSLGAWGYAIIPIIVGVIISFVSEFFYQVTPEVIRRRYTLWITTITFTILVTLIFDNYYTNFLQMILALIFNFVFAWLFYASVGKTFVPRLMKRLNTMINRKVDEI